MTPLGSPWPVTAESREGALEIGGVAAEELAARFGTPLYVYDAATLRERARAYLDGVAAHPDAHVSFACKARCTVGVLRLALPLSVVTSSYAEVHRVMLAGGLLALAVAAGIGIFVAGRVTQPVVEMQEIARRMSEGEYNARAPVRSVDELGALGRALNVMMARLREKIDDLQEERAKATAILDGMVEGVIQIDTGRDHAQRDEADERERELDGDAAADELEGPGHRGHHSPPGLTGAALVRLTIFS